MRRRNMISLILIISVIIAGVYYFNIKQDTNINVLEKTFKNIDLEYNSPDVNQIPESDFFEIIKSTKDGKDYFNAYKKVVIIKKEKISSENVANLLNSTKYKDLYTNLPKKDLYRVDVKGNGNLVLMNIIDYQNKKIVKQYGSMIIGMG